MLATAQRIAPAIVHDETADQIDAKFAHCAKVRARVLVVDAAGRIVMQRRDTRDERKGGKLSFFGGGRETGEMPLQTAFRELGEELSVKCSIHDLAAVCVTTGQKENGRHEVHYFALSLPYEVTPDMCKDGTIEFFDRVEDLRATGEMTQGMREALDHAEMLGFLPTEHKQPKRPLRARELQQVLKARVQPRG